MRLRNKKSKKKDSDPEIRDYIAIFIALLETTFLPIVIMIIIFIIIASILLFF